MSNAELIADLREYALVIHHEPICGVMNRAADALAETDAEIAALKCHLAQWMGHKKRAAKAPLRKP